MARDYGKEYRNYHGTEEQKTARAKRNKVRKMLSREGRVSKGDGKEVDHKKPLSKGGSNGRGNIRVVSRRQNRRKADK